MIGGYFRKKDPLMDGNGFLRKLKHEWERMISICNMKNGNAYSG